VSAPEPEPAQGWLVITAINTVNGGAGSSTFAVTGTQRGEGVERMLVTDGETGEKFMITTSEPGAVPLEVEPYRQLLRIMIDNDARYPGQGESLADYAAGASPELLALIERER
jgi:hypothetical protein